MLAMATTLCILGSGLGSCAYHFVCACPRGFEPDAASAERARATGASQIDILSDPKEAVQGPDVIYADVWASMGQQEVAALRLQRFQGFQIDEELISLAVPKLYSCTACQQKGGVEVTDGVIEAENSNVPIVLSKQNVFQMILTFCSSICRIPAEVTIETLTCFTRQTVFFQQQLLGIDMISFPR